MLVAAFVVSRVGFHTSCSTAVRREMLTGGPFLVGAFRDRTSGHRDTYKNARAVKRHNLRASGLLVRRLQTYAIRLQS